MDISFKDAKYYQYHTYQPYIPSYRNNDEIRIPINSQDLCTVPGDSKVYIEGTLTYLPKGSTAKPDDGKTVFLDNNAFAHLFDQVRYELNGNEIDRMRHVGVTSTVKTLLTCTKDEASALQIAGWGAPVYNATGDKSFCALIPLGHLLGFAHDFKGVLIRMKQELVLIRSRTNKNAYTIKSDAEENAVDLEVTKVQWLMPQVKFNLGPEKAILDKVQSNATFQFDYRSWEAHEYPQMPQINKMTWQLMTTSNEEAPTDIIVVLLTGRADSETKSASKFDHAKVRSVEVKVGETRVLYEKPNENFPQNKCLMSYFLFSKFGQDFSKGEKLCEPPLTFEQFRDENPMFVMKCLYEEVIKPGPLDIQISIEAEENFPPFTSAYAILVHEVTYSYQALTGIVKRIR